jgi:hypothetical protein
MESPMTFEEIQEQLNHMENVLKQDRGYDTAVVTLQIKGREEFLLDVERRDEFQRKVQYDMTHFHGTEYYFVEGEESLREFLIRVTALLLSHPSRAVRELTVLMNQSGRSIELESALRSQAGIDFVARLREERSQYAGLLADMRHANA